VLHARGLACCVSTVLDDSANALFVTEIVRGMAYTLKAYFDPKVTVSCTHSLSKSSSKGSGNDAYSRRRQTLATAAAAAA
jgi:hypothetical protein